MPRRKLWELDHRFHCLVSVLANDGRAAPAGAQGDISVGATMSDYELHHSFVHVAGNPVFAVRAIHKWLDRKFGVAIKRFNACRDAGELGSLWDRATGQGDVAGALWALITHPLVDAGLVQRVYGEVHMLSHLAGHSNRSTQPRNHRGRDRAGVSGDAALRRQEAVESLIVVWDATSLLQICYKSVTNPECDAFRNSPVSSVAYRYGADR